MTDDTSVAGRVAIVTGGTSGIGGAACVGLAADGAHVVVVGRDPDRLDRVVSAARRAARGGAAVLGLGLDVATERDADAMAAQVLDAFGQIDILVTAAGRLRGVDGTARKVCDMTLGGWDHVVRTNLTGVFLCCRAVLPAMIEQHRGDIINISSTSGLKGLAYDGAYCASKFGVSGFSEALAEEVERFGIRVHVLFPGAVDTPMWRTGDSIPHLGPALPVDRVVDAIRLIVGSPRELRIDRFVIEPSAAVRLGASLASPGAHP